MHFPPLKSPQRVVFLLNSNDSSFPFLVLALEMKVKCSKGILFVLIAVIQVKLNRGVTRGSAKPEILWGQELLPAPVSLKVFVPLQDPFSEEIQRPETMASKQDIQQQYSPRETEILLKISFIQEISAPIFTSPCVRERGSLLHGSLLTPCLCHFSL